LGRIYSVPLNATYTAAGTNTDLWSIQAADDKPVKILGFILGQTSEVGDAAEEGVRITMLYLPATFTVGSGGSAVTAVRPINDIGGAVWGATIRTNDTTVATTSGTSFTILDLGWNERASPYEFWFPEPRMCPPVVQTAGIVIRAETTIADDLTFDGTCFIEEEG